MDRKLITDCTRNGESFSTYSLDDLEILKHADTTPTFALKQLELDVNSAVRDFATAVLKARRG